MNIYYDLLGLEQTADLQQIKKAYKKLSTKFHPDKNNGDEYFTKMYLKIKEAYDHLCAHNNQEGLNFHKTSSNSSSFGEIYQAIRELRLKLGQGSIFENLEWLIFKQISERMLPLSKQVELIKAGNTILMRKIINEIYLIFVFTKNQFLYERLSTILLNLIENGSFDPHRKICIYTVRLAFNIKRRGIHGEALLSY